MRQVSGRLPSLCLSKISRIVEVVSIIIDHNYTYTVNLDRTKSAQFKVPGIHGNTHTRVEITPAFRRDSLSKNFIMQASCCDPFLVHDRRDWSALVIRLIRHHQPYLSHLCRLDPPENRSLPRGATRA